MGHLLQATGKVPGRQAVNDLLMSFRQFLLPFLMAPVCALAADKPNILFLFADDFCHEAVNAVGMTDIETPNLDRLANSGTVFTHAYNMGSWSGAVCVASRTMLNTGRYVWRAQKVYDKKAMDGEVERGVLWSQLMGKAGYGTFMTGKWHVPANAEKIFDVVVHERPGMPKTVEASYNRPLPGQPDPWSPSDPSIGGFWEGGRHWSEVGADDAIGHLNGGAGKEKPFFMYVAFNAPHDPRQAPAEYVAKYPQSRVKVPENFLPEYPYNEAANTGRKLRDERLAPFPRTEESVKVHRGEYYALITHLDAQIGRILAALDASGQADNTWIFFTADHGLAVGHHGLFGKQNMYDHSLRVPFYVNGPGVEKKKIDAPIYLQDVMATSLELAGAEKPDHVEFQSLLPLIRGESDTPTASPVYGAYLKEQRAIIQDGWKLIVYPKAPKLRLYHLTEDPQEMHDLAEDPAHAVKMKELLAALTELQAKMGDEVDLAAVFPE